MDMESKSIIGCDRARRGNGGPGGSGSEVYIYRRTLYVLSTTDTYGILAIHVMTSGRCEEALNV